MLDLIRKLGSILDAPQRRQLGGVFAAVVAMGMTQVLGIASIVPFMQLVAHPEAVERLGWATVAAGAIGVREPRTFTVIVGGLVLVVLTVSSLTAAGTKWLISRFAWKCAHALSTRLLSAYLYQPYAFFLDTSASNLSKQVLSEVNLLVRSVLLPAVEFIAYAFVTLVILGLLILVDPLLALLMLLVFGGAYATVYAYIRTSFRRLGHTRFEADRARFRTVSEAFSEQKTLKMWGAERYFCDRFVAASRAYTDVQPRFEVVSQTPRYFVELLAFGGILLVVLYLLSTEQDLRSILPLLSLYAIAGYRLLPSIQHVFRSASAIRFNLPAVDAVVGDLQKAPPVVVAADEETAPPLHRDLCAHGVTFAYPQQAEPVLRSVDVCVPKGAHVAFVGPTGSGKTTLVDLLAGLLLPNAGTVTIDGRLLTAANTRSWQRRIGYVAQQVVLFNDTIAHNIAYGIPTEAVDMARVRDAARRACVDAFIESLPDGYETTVGDGGGRLSGGQRQRIGLARALYRQPDLLILDEATSALDGITEASVMGALGEEGSITVISIAHRLSTVRACDYIYLLEDGQVTAAGTYDELFRMNSTFRAMARTT